jgi:uncharacterized protein YuzE
MEVALDINKNGQVTKQEIALATKILKKAKYQEQFRNFQR